MSKEVKPCCMVFRSPNGDGLSFQTGVSVPITQPPANDGVYKADGSPNIGAFKWSKPLDKDGFQHITFAVVLPKDGTLVDIPNSHNLLIAINTALTTISLDCMLKFDRVPFTGPDCADITIKLDDGSDPVFVQTPQAMAYNYFPLTKPKGAFSSVYNLKYLWALTNGPNFANDINETFRHELRHAVGCVHTTSTSDIMNPFYHEQRRPSAMDVYQVQFMYGPRNPPVNPIEVDAFYNGDARNIEFVN